MLEAETSGSHSEGIGEGSDLEAGQLAAVNYTHWLDLWWFAVQMCVVQSLHLTLLVPKPSCHFLSRYGSDQVLALWVAMEIQKGEIFDWTSQFRLPKIFTSTAITPPGLKRYGAFGASLFSGKNSGFG